MGRPYILADLVWMAAAWAVTAEVPAQDAFDQEPIKYSASQPDDAIWRLRSRIENDEVRLEDDGRHGYLKALLHELRVPPSSQVLVFSKTSFQPDRISPHRPRAIYFNDDVYVGWVQNSDTLEMSVADAGLGTNFYTLSRQEGKPYLVRQTHKCLQCHAASHTGQIPGHIVRSVYPGQDGMPIYRAGTFRTDQTSPFHQRWGGWYVSGTHGSQRHMGNVVVQDPDNPQGLDTEAGANVRDLSARFDTSPYIRVHSDIVALMVLEHQTQMHNLITAANFETRRALHYQAEMNRLLERPEDYQSDTTRSRIKSSCRRLAEYMLFAGEAPLTGGIAGTSDFAKEFESRGPFDQQGRSLRQFDLNRRLFRYRCSYLIYSGAFNGLPPAALEEIYRQLYGILTGSDADDPFAHLTKGDRQAILEILMETKQGLPEYWRSLSE